MTPRSQHNTRAVEIILHKIFDPQREGADLELGIGLEPLVEEVHDAL